MMFLNLFDDVTVEYLQNDVLRNETAEELAKTFYQEIKLKF